jgi:hypothetical protein
VKPEPIDDFERDLRNALARRPAPPAFKQNLLRRRQTAAAGHRFLWQRLAASILLAAVVSSLLTWNHIAQQRRRGEEARRQLVIALRITQHAMNDVQARLAAHNQSALTQGDTQ